MFKVLVMCAGSVLDKQVFESEVEAVDFASEMQDAGHKVRVMELDGAEAVAEQTALRAQLA
jgi:hypothetical protein